LEVPHSGFGYPLCGFSYPKPWKPFSAPNALGVTPSEFFSFLAIHSFFSFSNEFSALTLFLETFLGLQLGLQRLYPAKIAVPLIAS
jgi:hypothetical protein